MILCRNLILLPVYCVLLLPIAALAENIPDIQFNDGWLFHKGTVKGAESADFDDSAWRRQTLPHDWAIEGPFSSDYNARTGGLPVHGTGWYRKHFKVPANWNGKRISIEFDGAMSNAHVWVNGKTVGEHPYGYIGFELDITDAVRVGSENIIAVRLSPEDLSQRWYPGAGIYRNVRLKVNDPVHIPQWGTFVTTPVVTREVSLLNVETTLRNDSDSASRGVLETHILAPNGELIEKQDIEFEIAESGDSVVNQNFEISGPVLWDIGQPYLYKAVSNVLLDGKIVDQYETEFGIRSIRFDADEGFFLNGRQVRLNGACMHHDLGPLGAAVNYRATERQMQIMQSMGVNALRTSHNPPSPEVLQVCDRLGIVVLDEAFDEWSIGKVENGYNKFFWEWHDADLRSMVRRDRNHPSVIMWSLGNEILEQGKKDGWKIAKMLNDIVKEEDLTRPTTAGFNNYPGSVKNKLAHYIDIVGLNYKPGNYKELKEQFPDMIIYGSETSSQTSSRGVYHLPLEQDHRKETGHVSSHDVAVGPPWAYAPDIEFEAQEAYPWLLGEFIWTGFDYLGEPTPYGGRDNSTNGYWNDDWPSHSSYFAPVDLCGFPKDRFYLYQSQWTTAPMVHLLPHWNWEGREGESIPVFGYTNCDEAELFLNGKSLGRKVKGVDKTTFTVSYKDNVDRVFDSPYRLSWEVPYQKGELKITGYRNGRAVAEKTIRTAGAAYGIQLIADRASLDADGSDLAFVTVRVVDDEGNPCPDAVNRIHFEVKGKGRLVAVGNGDQTSTTAFKGDQMEAFSGMCLAIVGTLDEAGTIELVAKSDGLQGSSLRLSSR